MIPKTCKIFACSFIGLYFLSLWSCSDSALSVINVNGSQTLETEKVIYRFESKDTLSPFKRSDSTLIIFYFFQGFNDTIKATYNGTNFIVGQVFDDSSKVSSDYSGIHFGVKVDPTNTELQLELVRQKKAVKIALNVNYPLCTLHRENGVWVINYRINQLVLQ